MKSQFAPLLFASSMLLTGCLGASVKKDVVFPSDFAPHEYQRLAVINLDPRVHFSEYVEVELLKKGYRVKERSMVQQWLKKEGFIKEESFDPPTLARIGALLDVQGVVLCSVLEFSRFRDSYRLSIKMVNPATGNTIWSALGAMEGRGGQKSTDLLKEIVVSSLRDLPAAK
jgi:hypothetical protein